MALNAVNYYFMKLRTGTGYKTFTFKNLVIKGNIEQKILGVTLDNKLNFKGDIRELCKKFILNR